jgi:thioredoxin-like negative regulator of GroEL
LLELGATAEAKKLLEQNEEARSNNACNNARKGILKLMMNDPSGIHDLQDAVKLDPTFIEAELALAYAVIQNSDIEKAPFNLIKSGLFRGLEEEKFYFILA